MKINEVESWKTLDENNQVKKALISLCLYVCVCVCTLKKKKKIQPNLQLSNSISCYIPPRGMSSCV